MKDVVDVKEELLDKRQSEIEDQDKRINELTN